MKHSILTYAGLNALGTTIYITLIASFLFYAPHIFEKSPQKSILIPIAMLLLFVLSASITGSLVLGRPILWYLDGKKKEAVTLLMATLSCLFLVTLIAFLTLALRTK